MADGFYQTKVDVNDFPVLDYGTNKFKVWGSSALPCDEFVQAQERMVSEAASNGGYWLDGNGSLRQGTLPGWIASRPASLTYGAWWNKGDQFSTHGHGTARINSKFYYYKFNNSLVLPVTSDVGYQRRLDVFSADAPAADWAIYPDSATLEVVWGRYTANATGRDFYARQVSLGTLATVAKLGKVAMGNSTALGYDRFLARAQSVGGTHTGSICPEGFHPRGEDSVGRIGNTTGRTLSHLSHAEGQIADRFWCRSDLRFLRKFFPYTRPGVTLHPQAQGMSATAAFFVYGRVNCFYTADHYPATAADPAPGSGTTGLESLGDSAYGCDYPYHPLPLCDPDPDNNSDSDWRAYTGPEIAGVGTAGTLFGREAGEGCGTDAPPPVLAGFDADACVTAAVEIAENRAVSSSASPGVLPADRTLAVTAGRTAWDLDIAAPHPVTASAPRGSGDASGCADGSESRADHSSASGSVLRSQSPAPSYAASIRTDTAVPPNDADGDINYRGATRGMAHRYASLVAENTCAVKLAEAEAELALLEAREDAFAQWLTDYKAAADRYVTDAASYSRTPQQSGSGLAILRFNDQEANKETYAALLSTRYAALSAALTAAKTAYDTATDRTAGPNRADVIQAASDRNCVSHYDNEISRLKRLFQSAETSALGNGASGIKEERNAVNSTRLVVPAAITTTTTINAYTVPDIAAVESRSERYTECLDHEYSGGCWSIPQDETCTDADRCHGRTRVVVTRYYTCPGGSYTVSGSVSGRYGTATRTGSFSTTYAAAGRGESTSASCPGFVAQQGGTVVSDAGSYVRGTPASASSLPSAATVSAAATLRTLGKASLLGSYYPSHADRGNLTATADSDRRTAGRTLVAAAGTVPAGSLDAVVDYREDYTTAYDTAFRRAAGHMSGSVWNNFDWKYAANTLLWSNYAEDPATSFSASTATPRDGTGCDLIAVASDGTVSVEATRLDYETSSYGKGSVYSTRTDAQRTCKIRRTRTPELLLEYQPSVPSGTDASKAVSSFYVNYQPPVAAGQTAAERFKLYDEAEVFAVKTSLADSPPVFCGTTLPADGYLSHTAGQMPSVPALIAKDSWRSAAQLTTTVLRPTSNPPVVTEDHCFARPRLTATDKPRLIVFDDTAHSDMNLVYLQKDPDDTTGINLFTGGAFTKYALETYQYPGDNNQQSVFYGAIWEPPANDYAV